MSHRILVVEDSDLLRDILTRRLTRKGYDLLFAGDGEQAVGVARAERPDLILMDLSLPVLDGWSAAARIKSTEETRAIPIIALTANAMAGDREKALAAGCDEYDTKPIDFPRLYAKIEALLGALPGGGSAA